MLLAGPVDSLLDLEPEVENAGDLRKSAAFVRGGETVENSKYLCCGNHHWDCPFYQGYLCCQNFMDEIRFGWGNKDKSRKDDIFMTINNEYQKAGYEKR